MATPLIVPRADSEGGLGSASKYWGSAYIDLIYVGAGKIGRDADNLLDFSVDNKIKIRVENVDEYEFLQNVFRPITNDGAALGDSNHQWSDLALNTGGTINFNQGDVILTHTTDTLTLSAGNNFVVTTLNSIPFFTDAGGGSMYTANVQATQSTAIQNTGYGFTSLDAVTTGDRNTAIGFDAGTAINSGSDNVLIGNTAGDALTTGSSNVAVGFAALSSEDTGGRNTAMGYRALNSLNNDASSYNVAIGYDTAASLVSGVQNTLVGAFSGDALTIGYINTAFGYNTLGALTEGHSNTALGYNAMGSADGTESKNTAIGHGALATMNGDGDNMNTAVGFNAGTAITTGVSNVLIGALAGDAIINGASNVAIGRGAMGAANTSESQNVAIGRDALASMDSGESNHNTAVGYNAALNLTTATECVAIGTNALG